MPGLIVIRIIPQTPVDADKFTTYLNPPGLGPLNITVYDLSFNSPTTGQSVGTAQLISPSIPPSPMQPQPPIFPSLSPPQYNPDPDSGIVQQYDATAPFVNESGYFQLQSVATAIIPVANTTAFENLRLVAQWGSGPGATTIPLNASYYNAALTPSTAPDLNAWLPAPVFGSPPQSDPWAMLAPSLYLQLPAPPSATNPFSFQMPTDGTPPPYDSLLTSVQQVLKEDPGTSVTPNLAALTIAQCRNIAYEIIWSQQPPLPTPPDPIENLYSSSSNPGVLLNGTTPNQPEADRQQFEAQLKSYYAIADSNADRLTNFVYALSIAIACEEQSIAATQAMLEFPVNPGQGGTAPQAQTTVILTGVAGANSPTNFGVPTAYFYALSANMPVQITPQQRYQMATGAQLARLLANLTTAFNAGTVTDSEPFFTIPAVNLNAAQAARRIAALGVPEGSVTPFAPLGTVELPTSADTTTGTNLPFSVTSAVNSGMLVGGINVAPGTTVSSVNPTSVTLSAAILGEVAAGSSITFTPPYSADLQALIQSWLAYAGASPGTPSSEFYQPTDDVANFWPKAAVAHPGAFLGLVLSALTQDYVIPAPFNVALGDEITNFLHTIPNAPTSPTVTTLAGVTAEQWTAFFQANPTWLPPFTQPGSTAARIAAFTRFAQSFFALAPSGLPSEIVLATTAATAGGGMALQFAPTSAIVKGMSVSGPGIQPGAIVVSNPTTSATATSVPLSLPVGSTGVAIQANITLRPTISSVSTGGLPVLQAPAVDLLANCLANYGPFTFGSGFDQAQLQVAAGQLNVFAGDERAQAWVVEALITIDALWKIVQTMGSPPPAALQFSIVEALYARGFTSAAAITKLTNADFKQALIGTIAYDLSASIYAAAAVIAPPQSGLTLPAGGFEPINDGALVDCIPAPYMSPLGPIAYLRDILAVSELSTCEAITAPAMALTTNANTPSGMSLSFASTAGLIAGMSASAAGIPSATTVAALTPSTVTLSQPVSANVPSGTSVTFAATTLGAALRQRRGPVADLAASCANLETPLPLIDIVNECLEYMGSVTVPTNGQVYSTSVDTVAGLELCHEEGCPDTDRARHCHDPAKLFAALPEYSTPATPVAADNAVEPAVFNKLKVDFSSCRLPYSQALDVSRTYLRHFRSCRVEEMRTFRKCITEFVLDPVNEPAGFQSHLWRYPVRIDIAIEYLGISPEEYGLLFQGSAAPPCAAQDNGGAGAPRVPFAAPSGNSSSIPAASIPGGQFALAASAIALELDARPTTRTTGESRAGVGLPAFLAATCLSYCEFYWLWKSDFVQIRNGEDVNGVFPECEPCCLDHLWLEFGEERQTQDLLQLIVFVRLWRKLNESCCFCYSFVQLRDICDVLHLFSGTAVNSDFIRQLAAFQMLRDHFHLELADPADKLLATAVDADRTHLLALWVGPAAAKWPWAIEQLIERIGRHAHRHHRCDRRAPEFLKLLAENLDPLSRLCGFDPTSATDNWHAQPTHTLRFAEVLSKIYASKFSIGELTYLFTAEAHLDGDDPFPLQDANEAFDLPLSLPDDERKYSLWHLRHAMMAVEVQEDDVRDWHWKRIEAVLQDEFGYTSSDIVAFGWHFFPGVLEHAGYQANTTATHFVSSLAAASTSPQTWNTPADGSFQYDQAAQQLSTRVPLIDRAVIAKLTHVHDLNAAEQQAVQDLYFQPRAMLANFALLFADFATAERRLIQEPDEHERWAYFRQQLVLSHRRCRLIADHLSRHVVAATEQECPDGDALALLVLRTLFADENKTAASWENDSGTTPAVTWTPPPNGGAFAALLALAGTGLIAEYKPAGGAIVWRDSCGPLSGFGRERDRENCPVPTVLPALNAALTPQQMQFVSVHNGFLMKDATGAWLGGAQGFEVTWSGALLVEAEGNYEFWAGAPAPDEERPDCETPTHQHWRVTLRRGQRSWVILSHHWLGMEERRSTALPLKRGAYELTVELVRSAPEFASDEQVDPQRTGFQVKYAGPDSDGRRVEIPHSRLFALSKDQTLADGIAGLSPGASSYLSERYIGSLRDIRRTYQRAFKALLFAHRFALSAQRRPHGTSELGYMLAQKANFAGITYYRAGTAFTSHAADFDFNFLPLRDDYHTPPGDSRADPSPKRIQALFDLWERMFDYTTARAEVDGRCGRHLWHLFEEAEEKQPPQPASLLRHIGADERHWLLDLRYFQGQVSPVYAVSSVDLEDDRWVLRAWHADQWLRALQSFFAAKDITVARPDLWAADDPGAVVAGEAQTGNANLSAFFYAGCLENGKPRRYQDVQRLNDGLRERGRDALVSFLCHQNRVQLPFLPGRFATVARDLSDLLLLDVEAGIREKASRIDEAITAAQSFVRRARLGLEPGWTVTGEFARMWDREFSTFHVWQACKRRHLYKENWVEWHDLEEARRVEAYRLLESKLRSSELTIAVPGGLDWWPDQRPRAHQSLELLQNSEPSKLRRLSPTREGLNLSGTPERDARPSWLTAVRAEGRSSVGSTAGPGDAGLPYWMEAAIRLGTRFYRVAAAGVPPAEMSFTPHPHYGAEDCVTCCEQCGCKHPALVDEYYFWLIDGKLYQPPVTPTPSGFTAPPGDYQNGYQQDLYDPILQEAALWQDPEQLPGLLQWPASPMVRLAWCRVHNGQFQQPRRSRHGVPVQSGAVDLIFVGRTSDSLTFSVSNAVEPQGYSDPSAPGFRYDLATDNAIVLPQVSAQSNPAPFLNSLPAYPYFVFVAPGTHLLPLSPFSPSLAIARALRSHCRFEAALQWYRLAFDPLHRDCTWIDCQDAAHLGSAPPAGSGAVTVEVAANAPVGSASAAVSGNVPSGDPPPRNGGATEGACCDSTAITCEQARDRAVLLHYLETLVEWGDAIRRRGDSPQAFHQARVVFDAARLILGQAPRKVRMTEAAIVQTVSTFQPAFAQLNPRLLELYEVVEDRLKLIRTEINARRLRNGEPRGGSSYFGNDPTRAGWRTNVDPCADETDWCHLPSPYRFMLLIQKAQEYAARVEQLGGALAAAFEKGDAEYLESLRAGHELELLTLGLAAKKDQWRDADWQVEVLQKGKSVSQANLTYYNQLINAGPNGLIDEEILYQALTITAMELRAASNSIEASSGASEAAGNYFSGSAGFGGSPLIYAQLPIGGPIGGSLAALARGINALADIANSTAGLDLTDAGWQRRLDEWTHQTQILAIEIQQTERQILGAQRRRDQALVELNSHQRQIEQSAEVLSFLRDKFTAHDLYLFLQKETAALYRGTYDLALDAARQAQRAFNLERGHTTRRFIPECAWDNLHDGLMAGERLSAALRCMEKAYRDEDFRKYEMTRSFSLRLLFPFEYLKLRTTGCCEIEIPEWMFDLEYPGHYMRQIKSVTATIPCVTGSYTVVSARLTLLASRTRIDPRLSAPAHQCCCAPEPCGGDCCEDERLARGYEPCPDDPRIVRQFGAREAIATSTGQNDSGLFELNFNDERYLPFEYMGAVSRWRIELPPENNYFAMETVSDTILRLSYTAREGGELLRRAANEAAHRHLPGDGWRFLDVRHEFPDAWQLFRDSIKAGRSERRLRLWLNRKLFPFIPGSCEISVDKITIIFGWHECEDHLRPQVGGCPCPQDGMLARHVVEFTRGHEEHDDAIEISCVASEEWPNLYCGMLDIRGETLGRRDHRAEIEFRFPADIDDVDRIFLLCHYGLVPKFHGDRRARQRPGRDETPHANAWPLR
jgi:Tc toxin complex TcA C-terminal TcB-binding domain